MTELLRVIVLGVIALGVISLYMLNRSLQSQVDDLRTEVAVARIEGILGARPEAATATASTLPRRRQPGAAICASALVGALTALAGAWLAWG